MNSNENEKHPCRGRGKGRWLMFPFFFLAFVAVKAAIVHFLWNDIVPNLFHGPEITYVNAIELILLAKFLVGFAGWGGGGFRGRFGRGRWGRHWHHHHWHHHHEHHHGHPAHGEHRWDGLSAEERETLRQMIRERGER